MSTNLNSEGLLGCQILWLVDKSTVDYNALVEGVHYIVRNPSQPCPFPDGRVITYTEDVPDWNKLEWMVKRSKTSSNPDLNVYYENWVQRPTDQHDVDFPNYRIFIDDVEILRKSNTEIILAIRQKEVEANNSVIGEGGADKLNMLYNGVIAKLIAGTPLTSLSSAEQNVYNRQIQVSAKVDANAANAKMLIDNVNAGGTPDINAGWEYDNITAVSYPF